MTVLILQVVEKLWGAIIGATGKDLYALLDRKLRARGSPADETGPLARYAPSSPVFAPVLLLEVCPTSDAPAGEYELHWPYYHLFIRNVGSGVARSIVIDPATVSHLDYRDEPLLRAEAELHFRPIGSLAPGDQERASVTTWVRRFGRHRISSSHFFTILLKRSAGGERRVFRIRYESLEGTPLVQEFTLLHNEVTPGPILIRRRGIAA